MARDSDHLAGGFETENSGGFLAEEDEFDRRALWRLGSWGVASVGAVIVVVLANQSSIGWRREQVAAADLARQSQQIQSVARENLNETRRLASAIDTLNGDRDRLYTRVTVLEQGLDSVTGAVARQNSATAPAQPAPTAPPTVEPQPAAQTPPPAPVATTQAKAAEKPATDVAVPESGPATVSSLGPGTSNAPAATPAVPLMASKSMMAPPDPAAAKLVEPEKPEKTEIPGKTVTAAPMPEVVAAASAAEDAEADASQAATPKLAVQRTEFGVDVGSANSIGGLRALWRGLLKSKSNAPLTTLRPIIVVRENTTGLGLQLRLVAGPLSDAAAAAKICAILIENSRTCETTVFDGQRLAMNADEQQPAAAAKPTIRPAARRPSVPKRVLNDEPPKRPDTPSTISSLFGRL
jgi:hypothetical protein